MPNSTKQQALAEFSKRAIKMGAFKDPEKQQAIDKMVSDIIAAIPPTIRGEFDDDDVVAAYDYLPTYEAANGQLQTGPVNQTLAQPDAATAGKTSSHRTFTAPALSESKNQAIDEAVDSEVEKKYERGLNTKILKVTQKNPNPEPFFKELKIVDAIPDYTEEKLAEYEKNLFDNAATAAKDGFDSKKNFAKLKAANKKTALPIYFNTSKTIVGALIETPSRDEGKTEPVQEQHNITTLKGFLLADVLNVIGVNAENGLAVKVAGIYTKEDPAAAQNLGAASKRNHVIRLTWNGRKEVLADDASKFINYVNAVKREGGKIVTSSEQKSVRLDVPFKIKKVTNVGGQEQVRYQVVRPTGKANVPLWVRANETMKNVFGDDKSAPISARVNYQTKQALAETQKDIYKAIYAGEAGNVAEYGKDLNTLIASLRKADAATKATSDAMFA